MSFDLFVIPSGCSVFRIIQLTMCILNSNILSVFKLPLPMKKTKEVRKANLVDGMRIGDHSIKVFDRGDGKFLIIRKKYLFRIPVKTEEIVVDDYETVEDCLSDIRFEKRKLM
jgi:hypothetical protein